MLSYLTRRSVSDAERNLLAIAKLLVSKIHQTQLKLIPKTSRFDLYQKPSSEEAGTQFLRFLTRRLP